MALRTIRGDLSTGFLGKALIVIGILVVLLIIVIITKNVLMENTSIPPFL